MANIEEIGIENIIKTMNEHYKKFGRDDKFIRMENVIIKSGKIKYWYEVCKNVEGVNIEYFSRIMGTEFNKYHFFL